MLRRILAFSILLVLCVAASGGTFTCGPAPANCVTGESLSDQNVDGFFDHFSAYLSVHPTPLFETGSSSAGGTYEGTIYTSGPPRAGFVFLYADAGAGGAGSFGIAPVSSASYSVTGIPPPYDAASVSCIEETGCSSHVASPFPFLLGGPVNIHLGAFASAYLDTTQMISGGSSAGASVELTFFEAVPDPNAPGGLTRGDVVPFFLAPPEGVPEPSALMLMGSGLALLLLRRRTVH